MKSKKKQSNFNINTIIKSERGVGCWRMDRLNDSKAGDEHGTTGGINVTCDM